MSEEDELLAFTEQLDYVELKDAFQVCMILQFYSVCIVRCTRQDIVNKKTQKCLN
jgi:hypothetical protein